VGYDRALHAQSSSQRQARWHPQSSPQLQRVADALAHPQLACAQRQSVSFWLLVSFVMVCLLACGVALDCALYTQDAEPPVVLQVQSRQPCSAQVPHARASCLRSASRARNSRTPALLAEMPAASA